MSCDLNGNCSEY